MPDRHLNDRLFVGVLGARNAGKSHTWNTLFGSTVRTGSRTRRLELRPNEFVEVFLVSGSNEERNQYAGDVLADQTCRIVLCSMQYVASVSDTIDYAKNLGFALYAQWLTSGFNDIEHYTDHRGIYSRLSREGATVCERSGKGSALSRVQEIREFIYGWAVYRQLLISL